MRHAKKRGLDLSGHRARQLRHEDFAGFDRLYAMDGNNLNALMKASPPEHRHKLFLFLGEGDVPDPYYGGAEGFDHVLDLCMSAAARVVEDFVVARSKRQ